jgi:histidyl-tRNA synthetase
MGDMVLTVVLEELGLLPENRGSSPAPVMITVFDEDSQMYSYQLGAELRQAGIKATTYPTPDKMGKQLRHADRLGARVAIILGPDELKNQEIAIKDLRSGEQTSVSRIKAVDAIIGLLDNPPGA